jgi:hypothetical protein
MLITGIGVITANDYQLTSLPLVCETASHHTVRVETGNKQLVNYELDGLAQLSSMMNYDSRIMPNATAKVPDPTKFNTRVTFNPTSECETGVEHAIPQRLAEYDDKATPPILTARQWK